MLLAVRLVMLPLGLIIDVVALIVLALTFPLADTLLAVMLVMLPLGLVIDVATTVLALTNPLAEMLLAVMLVKLPMGLVIDVTALIVLALTNPLADMLLAVRLAKLPLGLVIDVAATVLALTFPFTVTLPVLTTTMFDLETAEVPLPMMKRSLLFELVTLNFPETCW